MPEGQYPQLPLSVWNGVRQILQKSPRRKLDDSILSVELGVQQTAARQYLRQLVVLGILGDDGTPTELADRWRQDDVGAIDAILGNTYPQALLELAPRDDLDRVKIVRWFTSQGYGSGAANNKAATYLMVAQPDRESDDISPRSSPRDKSSAGASAKPRKQSQPIVSQRERQNISNKTNDGKSRDKTKRPDLNVNVQIHISADASSDQIDAIFSAMKRHFDEPD